MYDNRSFNRLPYMCCSKHHWRFAFEYCTNHLDPFLRFNIGVRFNSKTVLTLT